MTRYPIGTRLRLKGCDVRSALKDKIATVVEPKDIHISFPGVSVRTTIRMEEVGDGHLYFTLTSSDDSLEFIEGPAPLERCSVNKKELTAYVGMIKRLAIEVEEGRGHNRAELIRCAAAAVDKIMGMFPDRRGIAVESER